MINAYYDFHDRQKIARKYGAVTLDDEGWIVDYVEKPQNPHHDQTRASLAIYGFPYAQFARIAHYVEHDVGRVEAPGHLISWLVKEQARTAVRMVRGYELQGKWSDIGNVRDLLAAVIWSAAARIDRLETVRHLLVADDVDKLDDKSFFMCHEIEVDGPSRTMRVYFGLDDPICKLDRSFGRAPDVKSVAEKAAGDKIWRSLQRVLAPPSSPAAGPSLSRRRLAHPLLLSAGVCLLDTSNAGQVTVDGSTFNVLAGDRTLIPLLERDAAAPVDPGRLTTAAGRLDMLDIDHVCYAELLEELVFYGTDDLSHQTRLYCCSPPDRDAKGRLLRRILEKRLEIPGIDRATIAEQASLQDKDIVIVKPVEPTSLILPPRTAWTVEMYLDDARVTRHDGMCVVADQPNGTLEFRRLAWANLTDFVPPRGDPVAKRVGRLLGIADGDGHGRRAFLVNAKVLINYQEDMRARSKDEICEYIFSSQKEPVKILGLTDGTNGRFSRMDAPMPLLSFTTSLSHLTRLLSTIVK